MSIISEFREFLSEYKVMGLAVGIIMGIAVKDFVNSLVSDIIMPLITPFIPDGAWKTAVIVLGPFIFSMGSFISQAINFGIIVLVIFLMTRIFRKGTAGKKISDKKPK
ncbi:MAG: MscL family protein [Candidatus Nanoarchaeia archaeon]|nr:MscL family protein [Candidatus Nanoarchaeia archaeon]